MKKCNIIFIISSCFFSTTLAQMPVITAVEPVSEQVVQYHKFEIKLDVTAHYANPYNYDEITITTIFTAPDGRSFTVDGFFMQDFELNTQSGNIAALNNGVFKVRFAPDQPGEWRYLVSCTTDTGTDIFTEKKFQCVSGSYHNNKGFVRRNATNYLQFDNGEQYIPIGENIAWQVGNPYLDYKKWLTKLANNGGNFFRLWQAHWGLGIEWLSGTSGFQGLRKYKQTSAFYQDWLFDHCAENNIYIMWCIQHHGQVSTNVNPNWNENPYNAVNGGPCQQTWDFFTDETARNHTKNRLRYIVARWAYARSIMAWELFNEVDWTNEYEQRQSDVANWHAEMAAYIKSVDPYEHLVTTSFAHDHHDPVVWHNPDIDFTQTHYYINIPNLERTLSRGTGKYLVEYNKPTLNAEFGLGGSASSLGTLDPDGIHIHNSLWVSLFSGAMGTAMSWWWDNYIEPRDLYHHFAAVSQIERQISFNDHNFKPITSVVNGVPADLNLTPAQGWGALSDTLFKIGADGVVMPQNASLNFYLYGSEWNTQYRRPPVFEVSYPQNGQFIVNTANRTGTNPKIAIWLDGTKLLETAANINQHYAINVPTGTHRIKVDNTGTDWISITSYSFTGLGSAVDAYTLVAEDSNKAVGWVLNNNYNHEFIKNHGNPEPALGATLTLENLQDGVYQVRWLDCLTGALLQTQPAQVNNGRLVLSIPELLWDLVFILDNQTVNVTDVKQTFPVHLFPNPVSGSVVNIAFELENTAQVQILLLDAAGREIQMLFNKTLQAGAQQLQSNISNQLPNGMYWVKISAGHQVAAKSLVIAKP